MTKQEKIIEAYGARWWDEVKDVVDFNGWLFADKCIGGQRTNCYNCFHNYGEIGHNKVRPKSLQGIEHNNGWIKIETESDLPKTGYYEVIERDSGIQTRAIISNNVAAKLSLQCYSHYQPIKKTLKPIY